MDEEADLALLDQHLLKTNALSQRMTSILAQLDTRLSRLDKSIAPLGLQPLTRKATSTSDHLTRANTKDIDAVLAALNPQSTKSAPAPLPQTRAAPHARSTSGGSSNGHTEAKGYSLGPTLTPIASVPGTGTATPADETALLTRGPDIMALGEYFTALDGVIGDLERMWKGFMEGRGGAREAGVKDLSKLVEVGFGGLVQLFLKLSGDGMGRMFEADQLLQTGPPTPPNFFTQLNTLLPLTTKIDQINSSSSTPKTVQLIQPILQEAISGFANLRGDWMRRSLSGMVTRIEEIDEGGIWAGGRGRDKVRGLVSMWEVLLVIIEAETLLITTLFPYSPPPTLLAATLAQPLNLVTSALQPTLNTVKRALSSHTFIALDLYQSLVRVQTKWETALQKCLAMTDANTSSTEVRDLQSALSGPISTLRSLASRSFPELLVDIRTAQGGHGASAAISDTTHSTLTYLETLPAYEKTVEGILGRSQSERSWLMGAKETPSPARTAGDEGGIVNLFVSDVLGTLIISLNSKARDMRRPIGQTFLLNNLSHIRNTTASFNSDIIGPGAEDMLNRAFRDAKAQYLTEWNSLVSLLHSTHTPRFGPNPLGNSERSHLKEALTAFFDRLSELERICAENPLNRQDPDMRDRVGKEVEDLVVGGYRSFYGKCQGKGVEKYLRGSPDEVGRRVQAIFR